MNEPIFSLAENAHTSEYEIILDLGSQPWGNDFLEGDQVGSEEYYPLKLAYCYNSGLLQLTQFVPKEKMFSNHTYLSGITQSLKTHFKHVAEENARIIGLKQNDYILDIGGNDGTQLLEYKNLGFANLINVESASNICKLSSDNDILTYNFFFNESNVRKAFKEKSIKLINASGVFFHLEELDSVIKGINYLLEDDGVFVVQFMYAGSMIENGNFDTIYHEHLCYYTLKSLSKLLEKYDLKIFDTEFSQIHSGSYIARVCKKGCQTYATTTRHIIDIEKDSRLYNLDSFRNFGSKIESNKNELRNYLLKLRSQGNKIYGYGAPVKGNTLLNYFKINNSIIDKIVEVNPLKIGKYTPGSHIPVVKESETDLPDFYLVLSHNFRDEIIQKNQRSLEKGTRFIFPFPEIEVIGS